MPVADALSDINTALSAPQAGGAQPGMSYSIAPSAPQSGVDAALADLAKPPEQLQAEIAARQPEKAGGLVRNLAAGGNETAASILGGPVDAVTGLINRITSPFTGTADNEFGAPTKLSVPPSMANVPQPPTPQPLITTPIGGSESIKSAMGLVGADPRNVGVNNTPDSVSRNLGADMASMVAPYLGARSLIARGIGVPDVPGAPPQSVGGALVRAAGGPASPDAGILRTGAGAAANAAVGAGASLGGQGAAALVPPEYQPLASMAGNMLGGGLMAGGMGLAKLGINAGVNQGREALAPMFQASREGLVGQKLLDNASDPEALRAALQNPNQEIVPGSQPTTFQLSGDQGVGQLERAQRTANPAPFLERAGEQNAARVEQVGALAPDNANPNTVRDLLQQSLARIDQEGDANITAAQRNAQQAYDATGGRGNPEDYGAVMRDQLEAAKAATKQTESGLWQAIDPDGTLTINAKPVAQAANQILSEIPKTAKPPEGEENAVLGFARMGGTAMPFSDFTALRGRLLQAIRDERVNGQTPALRRMQQLRSSMDDAISSMSANAAQDNPGLVDRLAQRAGNTYGGPGATSAVSAGGFGGSVPPANPGGGSQLDVGLSGTGGNPPRGFGSAPGYPGVQAPPARPQDLLQFLAARGGLSDAGGELRARDLNRPNRGISGIMSRGSGMPLDTAREIAAEAGYLHPDADINDLLDAIDRNQQGTPVFSDRDLGAASDWHAYENSRRSGAFDPREMPPLPGEPANWDAAAAARYRDAADATRQRAETFNNPQVGPLLAERGNDYRLANSQVPNRVLQSPESIQAYLAAGGSPGTLKDSLVADLKRSATNPDGSLNTTRYQSWLRQRADALRPFPDVQNALGTAATAQNAVDQAGATARQNTLDFQQGAARHFLNAEPDQAVRSALASKNPVADFKQLTSLVSADPDAKAGLQRAVADHISRNYIGNTEVGTSGVAGLKSDALQTFLKRNAPALSQVFSPDQMSAMDAVAADLQRSNRSIVGSKIPGQSNSAQDLLGQNRLSVLRRYLGQGVLTAAGGLGGYLMGGIHGAIEGAGGTAMVKGALDKLRASGLERTNQLMTEALLHPDLARTLLMKANGPNRPFIAHRLVTQLGTLLAVSGAQQATQH